MFQGKIRIHICKGEDALNYYEHHLGDYAAATGHLSLLEDAVYMRMIRRYYIDEAPLPADRAKIARLVGARSEDEIAAVNVVLDEFFLEQADGWHSKRCDEEIARYRDKQAKAKASAKASWTGKRTPKDQSHSERIADAERTHSEGNALQTPDTSNQTPKEKDSLREDFLIWYAEYPLRRAQDAAERAYLLARERATAGELLAAAIAYAALNAKTEKKFLTYPAKWLDNARWLDEDLRPKESGPPLHTVKRGTAEHTAWLEHLVAIGKHRDPKAPFLDKLVVPTPYPPSQANGEAACTG